MEIFYKSLLDPIVIPITDQSQVGQARRETKRMVRDLDFLETESNNAGIVASEIASNLFKHSTNGELLIQTLKDETGYGIQFLALDQGPGISNISQALSNGYSTSDSLGTGLGAIKRLSANFDIYSSKKKGTALLAQLWSKPVGKRTPIQPLEIGAVCLAKPGENISGDAWAINLTLDRGMIMVADGLGHGMGAAEAAKEAVRIFIKNRSFHPVDMIEMSHATLHHTRGVAMAVAEIGFDELKVRFVGVGNISSVILSSDDTRHMISNHGIIGHQLTKIQEFTYPLGDGALIVMYTDGLKSHWSLNDYPGLVMKHPALIAGVLYRDYSRRNDDITVLVVRLRKKNQ
jgi:anti-sigma regulatory factor (Ser/Thr protein kinase)